MINVAFCIDANFAPYLAVSLLSLLENTTSPVSIYIIGNLSEPVKNRLRTLESTHASLTFVEHKIQIPQSTLSDRYHGRLNDITYVRYGLGEILPDVAKVIYLDADILLDGDIKELWDVSLEGQTVGVVEDHSLMAQSREATLDLVSQAYFNAGVMVIDLEKWRKDKTFEKLLKVHASRDNWEYNDQDVLNIVLDQKVQYLDAKFNAQTYSLAHREIIAPLIIHFTGQEKPWHSSSAHPFTKHYQELFKTVPFSNNSLTFFLDKEDKKILSTLNRRLKGGGNIVVWGAGARGRRIIMAIEQDYPQFKIKQVVDTYYQGQCLNYPVVSTQNLKTKNINAIVIATLPQKANIQKTLRSETFHVI